MARVGSLLRVRVLLLYYTVIAVARLACSVLTCRYMRFSSRWCLLLKLLRAEVRGGRCFDVLRSFSTTVKQLTITFFLRLPRYWHCTPFLLYLNDIHSAALGARSLPPWPTNSQQTSRILLPPPRLSLLLLSRVSQYRMPPDSMRTYSTASRTRICSLWSSMLGVIRSTTHRRAAIALGHCLWLWL